MAVVEQLHVGDSGTEMRFRITDSGAAVNLSGATPLEMTVVSPGGVNFPAIALVATSDTVNKTLVLGWCKFDLLATHVDQKGFIQFQARVVDGGGDQKTSIATLEVFPNL